MKRILEGLFMDGRPSKREVKKFLKRRKKGKTICYVLLTCSEPKEDGTIDVEMKYDGKRGLAAYLIKSAKEVLEDDGAL
jgi:hypothetical protein